MEFLLNNWEAILGGIGSTVGIGTYFWGTRLKNAVKKLSNVITKVIEARKDGVITEKEAEDIFQASTEFLIVLIPFWRKWMGVRKP